MPQKLRNHQKQN